MPGRTPSGHCVLYLQLLTDTIQMYTKQMLLELHSCVKAIVRVELRSFQAAVEVPGAMLLHVSQVSFHAITLILTNSSMSMA